MARIPQFEQADVSSGVTSFDAPIGVSTEALSFRQLQRSIDSFFNQAVAEREQEAMQRQADLGAMAQGQAGASDIAQADQGLAVRYQQAFKERALQVHNEQVKLQAQQVVRELRRQHINDPEGFGQAWMTYAKSQADALRDKDPVQADAIGNYLTQYGDSVFQDLADARASREQAMQSQDYLDTINERFGQIRDELLNNPSEETYLSALSDLETLTQNGVASGLIDPSYAAALRDKTRDQYTEEWVRGEFTRSFTSGDMGGAKAVVEDLLRGGKFVNNDHARALANELMQNFKALEGNKSEGNQTAMRIIDRLATATELGGELDEGTLKQALNHVLANGTPDQQENAIAQVRGAYTVAEAKKYIDQVPVSDLKMTRQSVLSSAAGRDSASTRAVVNAIDSRIAMIEKAVDEGNTLAAGGEVPIQAWAERLDRTDDPAREMAQFRQALENRKEIASRVTGVMSSKTSPLFSNEEIDTFSKSMDDALKRGDFDEFNRQARTLIAPVQGNERETLAIVSRLAGKNGEAYAAAALHAMNGRDSADQMLSLAAAGKVANKDELSKQGFSRSNLLSDLIIKRSIDALAMGDDRARAALENAATDAYLGAGSRGMSKSDAKQEVQRIFKDVGPTVSFKNGAILPASVLGPSYVADPVKREFNDLLDNPARLGLPRSTPKWEMERITPRPLGDGSIGVYHSGQGRFMPDPETGRPFSIKGTEAAEKQGVQPPDPDHKNWFDRGASGVGSAIDTMSDIVDKREMERGVGDKEIAPIAAAIASAGAKTPVDDAGARLYKFMMRPNIAKEVDLKKFGINESGLLRNQNAARRVVGDRLSAYNKKFKGDKRAVAAAYWEGPELVDELQKQYGDKWFDALPMGTKKFVGRVEQELGDGR